MVTVAPLDSVQEAARDALATRIGEMILGAFDLFAIYLGERLGLYEALAEAGPLDARSLAALTGTDTRQVREWLEHQAIGGILEVADDGTPDERTFRLPAGHATVLLDRASLAYLAPAARMVGSVGLNLDRVADSIRTGAGVPWVAYGANAREGQADINRPVFEQLLAQTWLASIADVDARLRADPPALVGDLACGAGWSSQAIARAYPSARVHGLDIDPASIDLAHANLADHGSDVADRVEFLVADGSEPLPGVYDLVTILEALHDMARPVDVLKAVRERLHPDGSVVVMDERTATAFGAVGDTNERLFYGWSVLCCLPAGLAEPGSVGTGTVMRPETVERYSRDAGFSRFEVLPIEHETFRLYRLRP